MRLSGTFYNKKGKKKALLVTPKSLYDVIRADRNHLQIKEKLGFREDKIEREFVLKNDKFGLRTLCSTGFTLLIPRASYSNLKSSIAQEI